MPNFKEIYNFKGLYVNCRSVRVYYWNPHWITMPLFSFAVVYKIIVEPPFFETQILKAKVDFLPLITSLTLLQTLQSLELFSLPLIEISFSRANLTVSVDGPLRKRESTPYIKTKSYRPNDFSHKTILKFSCLWVDCKASFIFKNSCWQIVHEDLCVFNCMASIIQIFPWSTFSKVKGEVIKRLVKSTVSRRVMSWIICLL